jgi:hypothetical protein
MSARLTKSLRAKVLTPRGRSAGILAGTVPAFLFAVAFSPPAQAASPVLPVITNLVAVQRPGTFYVDVTYDLIDPDSPGGVYILAEASSTGGASYGISMRTLSGDVGMLIPGVGKKIVWNAWND